MQALVVVTDASTVTTANAIVAQAGWRFVSPVPTAPWDLSGLGVALTATVTDDRSVAAMVEAAARGAAVVAATQDPAIVTALVEDLGRIGPVELWSDQERPPAAGLTPEEVELVCALATGQTLGGAARGLYLSRRTADRRLADARRRLAVATTPEALCLVGEMLERWSVPASAAGG